VITVTTTLATGKDLSLTLQGRLFMVAAVAECLAGLALIVVPGAAAAVLLGAEPDSVGLMIGRVGGFALLSLGIACWGARSDAGGSARTGTLTAITFYNFGAGLLLAAFAATGNARGMPVWVAAVLHLSLALGFVASLRNRSSKSD
jgi:hypothetical protein